MISSPWGADRGGTMYINNSPIELKADQAIVLRPASTKYAFTYKVEINDVIIKDFEQKVGGNGALEDMDYVSGNVADQEYGVNFASPDKGQVVVLNTQKEMSGSFTRLANSSEITGNANKEMRTLKVNLFDYDLGFDQLIRTDSQYYNLGHNPYNQNVSDQNHGVEFRFEYDSTNNGKDPAINWGNPTKQTTGIVSDSLNRVTDASGKTVSYLTPSFNYTTQFDPFSLSSWKGAGYDWVRSYSGDTLTVAEETKTVFPNVDFEFVYNYEDGSYSYNSHQHHAQLTSDGKTVYQYSQALGLGGIYYNPTEKVSNEWGDKAAGFFPFDGPEATNFYGDAYTGIGYYGNTLLRREGDLDYHFGLSMEHQFTVPYDGKINGHDMVFSISGDDDIWLFVDGKLVLDLGGIHEALSGEINFTKGTYTVNGVTKSLADVLDGYAGSYPGIPASSATTGSGAGSAARSNPTTGGSTGAWAGGTDHTFQLFYLERGGTLSDLSISFNLPQVAVNATKVWDDEDNKDGSRQDAVLSIQQSTDGKRFTDVEGSEKTISKDAAGDDLTVQWTNLPLYNEQGKKLEYRVVEAEMEGYIATIVHDGYDYTVTNSRVPVIPEEPTPEEPTPEEPTPVEPTPVEPTPEEPVTPPATHTPHKSSKTPQTGDESNIGVWVAVLTVSGVAAAAGVVLSKRKRKQ